MKPDYKKLYDKAKELIELLGSALQKEANDDMPLNDALILVEKWDNISNELHQLEAEIEKEEKKPKRKRNEHSFKICAGCGSFAHGNPGHDIT